MHILVTNDDGVDAPGLMALNQALGEVADTIVFAPSRIMLAILTRCGN